jgi:hypothetical protein
MNFPLVVALTFGVFAASLVWYIEQRDTRRLRAAMDELREAIAQQAAAVKQLRETVDRLC